jgi:N,N'-diacetyllegionaminate synthase
MGQQEKTLAIGGQVVGGDNPVFIIAELGSNHDGKLDQAKALIDVAAAAGCDAVKLQIPIAEECYPPDTKFGEIYGDEDISDVIRGNEIPPDWIPILVQYGNDSGLQIGASTDGFIGLKVMLEGGVDFIKIPSFTISHIPLLREASATGLPLLMSTGVHSVGAIEEALAAVSPVVPGIFHCISAYPTPLDALNLATMTFLRQAFGIPTGFSDHSIDPVRAPVFATSLGAKLLEKHFTLDRELEGTDHFFAIEPEELKEMVAAVRRAENDPEYRDHVLNDLLNAPLIGTERRGIFEVEEPFCKRTRLGLYFRRSLVAGERIAQDDVRVYRCADTEPGLHPRYLGLLKDAIVTSDADAFQPVTWAHVIATQT